PIVHGLSPVRQDSQIAARFQRMPRAAQRSPFSLDAVVDHDPIQPARELRSRPKPGQLLPDGHEAVLNDVLCEVEVPRDSKGGVESSVLILLVELCNRLTFPLRITRQKLANDGQIGIALHESRASISLFVELRFARKSK